MIRVTCVILAAVVLAGCGADGEPVQPTASIDASVSSSGSYGTASVNIGKGPWNISVGMGL